MAPKDLSCVIMTALFSCVVSGEKILCSVHFPPACTRTVDNSEGTFFRSNFHFSKKGKYL